MDRNIRHNPSLAHPLLVTGAAALALTLTGCPGGDGENNTTNNTTTNNTTTTNNNTTTTTNNNTTTTNNNNTTSNNTTNTNTSTNTNMMGSASLSFKVTLGSNFPNQLPSSWRPLMQFDGESPLVVMLCETSDATCKNPVSTTEITDHDLIQSSFGPEVTVENLPAGDYKVMVFADSQRSIDRGFDWRQTPEKTIEEDWGGHVSEFDLMMSDPGMSPSNGNPAPMPVDITLTDGSTTELGDIVIQHFHERRVDPEPVAEDGAIAVVTENGLRVIDLNTFEVEDAGGGFRDYFLQDSSGNDLSDSGSICGMIKGPGSVIYVLFSGGSGAGFAVPFDVQARQQLHGGNIIEFPGPGGETPCSGTYHENGGSEYLYVVNASASGTDKGETGLWWAEIDDLPNGNVSGNYLEKSDDDLFEVGFNAVVAHGDTLYATMTPEQSDSPHVPADTLGQHTVFQASIAGGQAPDFQDGGDYTYWMPMPTKDGVTLPSGDVDCVTPSQSGGTFAGLHKSTFHDGKTLLFVGGCSRIAVFDLDAGMRFDAAPDNPRSMDIDGTLFGHGFTRFAESPDGNVLYALPQFKSQFHFYFAKDGDPNARQTFNRYMIFPLALDQGDAPALHPDFTGEDIDGHEGTTNIGDKSTPAEDPGIDVNVGHMTRYMVKWSGSLAGSTNQSGSIPTGPSLAAGNNTIWLRGSGIPGNSGLAKGSNLFVYSIPEKRAVLWSHLDEWDFYHWWQGGNDPDKPFGYDLTPEGDGTLATYGLLYVSTE